ncbi:hypothetical protein DRH27_00690 [Candidatus Falkowbacteria bacterium]|nr:MAG: hypothetical protein DRH27_00690 [Candidatus Falkowbacteria bacterium]
MYLEVIFLPYLIPWVKSKNRFVESMAPPEEMRKIWIGQKFFGEGHTTGAYQDVTDKKAPLVRRVILDENAKARKKLTRPKKLVVVGDKRMEVTWHLSYAEGMKKIRKATDVELIIKWYEYNWPEESPFIFSDDEVHVFPEPDEP